tara:strand:+ start:541 stop:1053 length:513 start_codon:yes stop_codon:yes gene_type:complete
VSKYIQQATVEAAIEVASNLLPADRSEVQEGHGHDPETALVESIRFCESVYFKVPNGKIAGLAGVHGNGQIWMLCTPAIYDYPHTFAREAMRYVEGRREELLWNIVDERNKVHLKLLRFLGFKFLRRLSYGPNNLSFIEFCRVRSSRRGFSSNRRTTVLHGSQLREQSSK